MIWSFKSFVCVCFVYVSLYLNLVHTNVNAHTPSLPTLSINRPNYNTKQPQVLWRGSDFDFLPNLRRPMEKRPFDNEIEQTVVERKLQQEYNGNKKKATARGLRAHYDTLLPRWKGTVLTAVSSIKLYLKV